MKAAAGLVSLSTRGVVMAGRSKEDRRTIRNRLIWEDSSAWVGRIFAIMLFMVGPSAAGMWLDRQLGTKFLAAIGVMVGMGLGITALLVLVGVQRPTLDDQVDDQIGSGAKGETSDGDRPH